MSESVINTNVVDDEQEEGESIEDGTKLFLPRFRWARLSGITRGDSRFAFLPPSPLFGGLKLMGMELLLRGGGVLLETSHATHTKGHRPLLRGLSGKMHLTYCMRGCTAVRTE